MQGGQGPISHPGCSASHGVPPCSPRGPSRSVQAPAPEGPRSWGWARANQLPHSHEKRLQAGRASSGSWVPAASGLLLCLQQLPHNIVSTQLSGIPTQSDFLHSAALPIPKDHAMPAMARQPLFPSQLGQRGNRASATAAWGLGTAAATSLWLPTLSLSLSTGQNRLQKVAPEIRAYSRGQGWKGASTPPGPSCALGLGAGGTSLTLVLPAAGRKWKETENWRLSLLLHHSFSSSPSCLGPQAPSSLGDHPQSKAPEPALSPGLAKLPPRQQPLTLLPRVSLWASGWKVALVTQTATGTAAVMSA